MRRWAGLVGVVGGVDKCVGWVRERNKRSGRHADAGRDDRDEYREGERGGSGQ